MYAIEDQSFCCPTEITLYVLNDKWKLFIIYTLLDGPKRFKDICESFPNITQKTISIKLKELEATHMIHRKVFAEVPPKVEYSLTDIGKQAEPMLKALYEFGLAYASAYGKKQ